MNRKHLIIIIGLIIILLDQITKILVINENIILIPNLLLFTYTQNTGTAFGIGSNNAIIIIILNIIVLGVIIKFLKERKDDVEMNIFISLILIASGGISNLIDRIFRGYVVDFIDVNLFNFPNFNVADISIIIGIGILLIVIIKSFFSGKTRNGKIKLPVLKNKKDT